MVFVVYLYLLGTRQRVFLMLFWPILNKPSGNCSQEVAIQRHPIRANMDIFMYEQACTNSLVRINHEPQVKFLHFVRDQFCLNIATGKVNNCNRQMCALNGLCKMSEQSGCIILYSIKGQKEGIWKRFYFLEVIKTIDFHQRLRELRKSLCAFSFKEKSLCIYLN